MTYFPDGATLPMSARDGDDVPPLSVGWLDALHQFPTGSTPDAFADRLAWLCVNAPVNKMRGFHVCQLCPPADIQNETHFLQIGSRKYLLGSAEIRVRSARTIYAAPTLALHYVVDHHYLTPRDFVSAVLAMPTDHVLAGWELRRGPYWRVRGEFRSCRWPKYRSPRWTWVAGQASLRSNVPRTRSAGHSARCAEGPHRPRS